VDLRLTIRDLEPKDLADLDWSGGPEHLRVVAETLAPASSGEAALLVAALPNDRLVALGGVDFRPVPDAGLLWMLAVHETVQSLGIGTRLVRALEQRAAAYGCAQVRLGVEHDNPRAIALYRRLGYRESGTQLESWPVAGGRTYVTVCTVLERRLP
jgi:ribosomal protein S18 acetylase RimI-like enzyme